MKGGGSIAGGGHIEGFDAPLHRALTEPILLGGAPRGLYLTSGIRERAAELVSLDLGPRADIEIEDTLRREIEQERLTSIDRRLLRDMDEGRIVASADRDSFYQSLRAGRLQKLGHLGLADEIEPGRWRLAEGMDDTLRRMGERGDIIRTMQRAFTAHGLERLMAFKISHADDGDRRAEPLPKPPAEASLPCRAVSIQGTDGGGRRTGGAGSADRQVRQDETNGAMPFGQVAISPCLHIFFRPAADGATGAGMAPCAFQALDFKRSSIAPISRPNGLRHAVPERSGDGRE